LVRRRRCRAAFLSGTSQRKFLLKTVFLVRHEFAVYDPANVSALLLGASFFLVPDRDVVVNIFAPPMICLPCGRAYLLRYGYIFFLYRPLCHLLYGTKLAYSQCPPTSLDMFLRERRFEALDSASVVFRADGNI
jgi:hypothetical protein